MLGLAAFGFESSQRGCGQVHEGEDIGEATRELLLELELAAENAHGQVGHEGKRCGGPG